VDTGEGQDRTAGGICRLRSGEPGRSAGSRLVRTVKGYNAKADLKEIERAYRFAAEHHEGQKRLSGEDFIEHPVAVAQILADLGLDTTTLQAALVHDTVEDTDVSVAELEAEFGPEVSRIVDGLTSSTRSRSTAGSRNRPRTSAR
jgi:GTP pyrophosphokinase